MKLSRAETAALADAFLAGRDQTNAPQVRAMLRGAAETIHREFAALPIEVRFTERDPYASYQEMRDQVLSTGVLYIWTGASDVPMWDAKTNWMARAVHDWDHITSQFDFTMDGEFAGYLSAARKNPGLAPIYLSEIAMQAAVANAYGTFAPEQKIVLVEDPKLQRWLTNIGTNGLGSASDAAAAIGVADLAAVLTTTNANMAMLLLGRSGMSYNDARVLLDAALIYNALMQGAMKGPR